MPNPEQVLTRVDEKPLQQLAQEASGKKLMSEVYRPPSNDTNDKRQTPKMNAEKNSSTNLENEGNVASLKLPGDYSRGNKEKTENFHQFNSGTNKDTKVCYWGRADFAADDEDSQRIKDVFKKAPHKLNEQETLDVMPMMMPGRPWGTGNYKDLELHTADIDGRRVLLADFKFEAQDKKVHLIMANQNPDKHQIENIWVEGPAKDFEENNKAVLAAFDQIKWKKAP